KEQSRLSTRGILLRERALARAHHCVSCLDGSQERLLNFARTILTHAQQTLDRNRDGLPHGTRKHLRIYLSRLELRVSKLTGLVQKAVETKSAKAQQQQALVLSHANRRLRDEVTSAGRKYLRLSEMAKLLLRRLTTRLNEKVERCSPERFE